MGEELARLREHNQKATAEAILNHLEEAEKAATAGDINDAQYHRAEAAKLQLAARPQPTWPTIDWQTTWDSERGASFLVDPLIPEGRQVVIVGPSKAGKSELALWVAAHAATGSDLYGQPIEPIPTLYVDMEMIEDDVLERLTDFGFDRHTDLSLLVYCQYPPLPPLDTAQGGEALAAEAQAVGARLVVIDTLSKVVEGEENSSDTYLNFAKHTGGRLRNRGISAVYLDHTGKDLRKGARGSSAKNDHADAVYRLTRHDRGIVQFDLTHRRVAWLGPIALRRVEDEEGIRYRVEDNEAWPAGTSKVAADLDELGASLDIGGNAAAKLLSDNGRGRRRNVVLAAVRYRKASREPAWEPHRSPGHGTTPGTTRNHPRRCQCVVGSLFRGNHLHTESAHPPQEKRQRPENPHNLWPSSAGIHFYPGRDGPTRQH